MSKAAAKKASTPRIFVPLTKIDVEQRLVYGQATQEVLDKADEMMDYDTSKPFFEAWSGDIEKATDGKSKGNVRVMHGMNACGKLTEIEFDDTAKSIDVCAKIVDDQEWEKVQEGVYTGFSVGGKYEKKWTETIDGKKVKKYTANPSEISIVDNPCVPSATFTMTKADGTEQQVAFQVQNDDEEWPGFGKADQSSTEEPKTAAEAAVVGDPSLVAAPSNEAVVAKATEIAKTANDGTTWMDHVTTARDELTKAAAPAASEDNEDKKDKGKDEKKEGEKEGEDKTEKVTPVGLVQKWVCPDGEGFEKKADAEAHMAKTGAEGVPEQKTEEDKVETPLAIQLREAMDKVSKGLAAFDPVESSDPNVSVFVDFDRLHKAYLELEAPRADDGSPALEKGMYTVSRFANMLGDVASLARSIRAEGAVEGDSEDESVASTLKDSLTAFGESFKVYAAQQVAELISGIDVESRPYCYDYYCRAVTEDGDNQLAKDVVSLFDETKEFVELRDEQVAEISEKLAKGLQTEKVEEEDDEGDGDLAKVTRERDDLAKVAQELLPQMAEMAKRLDQLEKTPMPRAPREVIEKDGGKGLLKGTTDQERLAEVADLVKTLGPDQLALMMIKASHAQGGHQLAPAG